MAFPAFVAHGNRIATTGSATGANGIPWPAGHAAGEVGILYVETANEAPATPSGWSLIAQIGTGTAGGTSATMISIFGRRATSGAMANAEFADPGNHFSARITTFSGAISTGDFWEAAATATAASSSNVSFPDITTLGADRLVVHAVTYPTDTNTGQGNDDPSNANLANLGGLSNLSTTQGNGGGWYLATGQKATAGAVGNTTATLVAASVQALASFAIIPEPVNDRRAQVYFAEMEVPTAPRRAQVYFAELEVPNAPRRAQVYFAELEVPDVPSTDRRAQVYFAEFEVPSVPRRAQVYFAEFEVPTAPRRAHVYFAELEVPNAPRRAHVYFAELEVPTAPRRAQVYFVEMEVPTAPRRAQVYFAAFEVPDAPTNDRRAHVYFVEFEVPNAPIPVGGGYDPRNLGHLARWRKKLDEDEEEALAVEDAPQPEGTHKPQQAAARASAPDNAYRMRLLAALIEVLDD